MLDSSVIRAHACSAGAPKEKGQEAQALGYSRGGFSSKIHVNVDALGNPLRFILTAGQAHEAPKLRRYLKATERSSSLATRRTMLTLFSLQSLT